jgi:hypothetical protein
MHKFCLLVIINRYRVFIFLFQSRLQRQILQEKILKQFEANVSGDDETKGQIWFNKIFF